MSIAEAHRPNEGNAIESSPLEGGLSQNGQVELIPQSGYTGGGSISILVKRSYQIVGGVAVRAEKDSKFRLTDVYYDDGDPETSTVQFESEMAGNKQGTDVVVVGSAYAPNGKPVHQMQVSAQVAGKTKTLQVTGDRVVHYNPTGLHRYSDPKPFQSMQLRYEYAYGGVDERSDPNVPFWYPRNDHGKGVVLGSSQDVIEGLALPNIEDPNDLLTPERLIIGDPHRWHLQPLPQGFGWRQKTWFPRCCLIGSCPPFLNVGSVTEEEKMGLLPKDYVSLARQFKLPPFIPLFNNGASLGMIFRKLDGHEKVRLSGMTPSGVLEFTLPAESPSIALDLGKGMQPLEAKLLTVSIRPDELQLDMIWAGVYALTTFVCGLK